MSIYVRDADGNRQKIAGVGLPGPAGKSAYQYAVEGGFSGTEEEFRAVVGIRNNDNLLDNWYLADPINQRGQTKYAVDGYAIDRWYEYGGTLTLTSGKITHTPRTEVTGIFQSIDNPENYRGKQLTFSCKLASGSACLLLQVNNSIRIAEKLINAQCGFISAIIPENTTRLDAYIFSFETQPFSLEAVKLELGPVQTLAHKEGDTWVLDPPPDPALELAKCQRYAQRIILRSAVVENVPMYGWPANKGRLCVNLSPPMRITPTLVYFSGRGYKSKTSVEFTTEIAILYDSPSTDQVVLLINDPEILAVNAQLFLSSDL